MIYIVHGEAVSKSRALITNQQKKLGVETKTELNIKNATPLDLLNKVTSGSLFGDFPFVVFNITELGRKSADEYIEVLKKVPAESTLIVFSEKQLTKSNAFIKNASSFEGKIIENEKAPESDVFKFLEGLGEKKRKSTYAELARLENEGKDSIYILSMIQYLVKNMAYIGFNSPKATSINPYVKSKMSRYANNYTRQNFIEFYDLLYMLEKKAKTGGIDADIALTLAVEKMLNSM